MRSVIVTDSALSVGPATAVSINRKSGLFSAQKPASASSLSKIGMSSHLAIASMLVIRERHFSHQVGRVNPLRDAPRNSPARRGLTRPTCATVTVHQLQASDQASADRRNALRAQTDGHG